MDQVGLEPEWEEEEERGEKVGPTEGEQVLEAFVHNLVHTADPSSAPELHSVVRLRAAHPGVSLRRQRAEDVAILMQPLDDTIGERIQETAPHHARRAAVRAVCDVAASLSKLEALIQFRHGDLHPDNVMYNPKKRKWCMIDFGRSCVSVPGVEGVIAVDPELPQSSNNRDLASLIGNLELIWEHECGHHAPIFPQIKTLLRQKYGLPLVNPDSHWMAPMEVREDHSFAPKQILITLQGGKHRGRK